VASGVWQQGISSWRSVHAGICYAWPLPADARCATVARQAFRDAVSEVGLESGLLEDGVLMASELAANTLHAQAVAGAGGGGDRLVSVIADVEGEPTMSAGPAPRAPRGHRHRHRPSRVPRYPQRPQPPQVPQAELWLYLRGVGPARELVCKVFDCCRGWRGGAPPTVCGPSASEPSASEPSASEPSASEPSVTETAAEDVGGRGLRIVHELSGGRWGHHPTRARLDNWGLCGKAVWFAVPAPLAHARLVDVTGLRSYTLSADVTAARATDRLSARQAARELKAMLDERGFGSGLVHDDQPARDLSILSVRRGLTVWCQAGVVSLTTPWGSSQQWNYADLVEAAEQTVRRYEELDLEYDLVSAPVSPVSAP
jgi:hypothetical protein